MNVGTFRPLVGSSFVPTAPALAGKEALKNIQNVDDNWSGRIQDIQIDKSRRENRDDKENRTVAVRHETIHFTGVASC